MRFVIAVWLCGFSLGARAESRLFTCYQDLNKNSKTHSLFGEGHFGIEYKTDLSFDLVTAEGLRTCTVPPKALLTPGNPQHASRYVSLKVGEEPYYLGYGPSTFAVPDYKEMPKDTFAPVKCDPPSDNASAARWLEILRGKVDDQEACGTPPAVDATCIARLVEVLQGCESHAGDDALRKYFKGARESLASPIGVPPK